MSEDRGFWWYREWIHEVNRIARRPRTVQVALALAKHADNDTGLVLTSQYVLALECGYDDEHIETGMRRVRAEVARLCRLGMIRTESGRGRRTSRTWLVEVDEWFQHAIGGHTRPLIHEIGGHTRPPGGDTDVPLSANRRTQASAQSGHRRPPELLLRTTPKDDYLEELEGKGTRACAREADKSANSSSDSLAEFFEVWDDNPVAPVVDEADYEEESKRQEDAARLERGRMLAAKRRGVSVLSISDAEALAALVEAEETAV